MLVAPLIKYLNPSASPTVLGLSGYSGAGTITATSPDGQPTTAPKVNPARLGGGVKVYSLTDHIHEREASYHLSWLQPNESKVNVHFTPAVTPWFSGIISTLSFPLAPGTKVSARDVVQLYKEFYAGEKLVRVKEPDEGVVELKEVEGNQGFVVGGVQVSSQGDRVVVVVSGGFLSASVASSNCDLTGRTR